MMFSQISTFEPVTWLWPGSLEVKGLVVERPCHALFFFCLTWKSVRRDHFNRLLVSPGPTDTRQCKFKCAAEGASTIFAVHASVALQDSACMCVSSVCVRAYGRWGSEDFDSRSNGMAWSQRQNRAEPQWAWLSQLQVNRGPAGRQVNFSNCFIMSALCHWNKQTQRAGHKVCLAAWRVHSSAQH